MSKKIDYYAYSYFDLKHEKKNHDYQWNLKNLGELPNLCNKFNIKKNLIKPIYLS